MCGIAGVYPHQNIDTKKLLDALKHRGPDAQNSYFDGSLALLHARLSIQDIECGTQPMSDGALTIVFNGEIYNHSELRTSHLSGEHFSTRSDTETLLKLFARHGFGCLDYLDGMFAFCIYDKNAGKLYFARDRAGKKPLYYFFDGKSLLFASELNALKTALPLEVDDAAIQGYLRLGYFYKSATPYKNVFELEAGSVMEFDLRAMSLSQKKWWSVGEFYKKPFDISLESAIAETDRLLTLAVQRRLLSSDLEVGCFLSGGIDSGLVTAIAAANSRNLRTFTVSFKGAYDEAPLARLVAKKYGTKHTEIAINADVANDAEKILAAYGEPFFDSSAIPSWYVSLEAKRQITVVLNGDGADELFGGYRRYVPFAAFDFFALSEPLRLAAKAAMSLLPVSNEKKSYYNYFYRLLNLASKKELHRYISATTDIFEGFEQNLLDDNEALAKAKDDFAKLLESGSGGLSKLMNFDFEALLAGDLLVKMDIATMQHALEGRSPFLSKELLEFAPRLPDTYKINGKTTKYLLRRLAEKYLPLELLNQPKRGFEVPLKAWVDNELKEQIFDALKHGCYSERFVKRELIDALLEKKVKVGDEKRAKMLWALFALEVWRKNL